MTHFSSRARILTLTTFAIVAVGCAAVDPQPFGSFRDAVVAVHTNADRAWERAATHARTEHFDVAVSDVPLISDDMDAFRWAMSEEPRYTVVERNRAALFDLTGAFVHYAEFLVQLAEQSGASDDVVAVRAGEFNQNLRKGFTGLGLESDSQ